MNFLWFDTVTRESIKDLRDTTYVQPPARFRFILQPAQHAVLRASLRHSMEGSCAQQLAPPGRPAVNASDGNCAQSQEGRLHLFSSEDWPALWAKRNSHVFAKLPLLPNQENEGALWLQPGTLHQSQSLQIVQEIKSLHPADPDSAVAAQTPVSNLYLPKLPRSSQAHSDECHDSANLDPSACVLNIGMTSESKLETATCLCKLLPTQFCSISDLAKSHSLPNPQGTPTTPSWCPSFADLPSSQSWQPRKSVAQCARLLQYGVGRPDGANTMIKTIQYLAEADPTRVLVALDLNAAFQNGSRRAMPQQC